MATLTPDEVWFFQQNGFLMLRQCLDEATVQDLREATERNVREMADPLEFEPDAERQPEQVRRLSKILDRDPIYMRVATSDAVLEPLSCLLGPNLELMTNRHNHLMVRPPGSAPVYWHRDLDWGLPFVTALIYLDASTPENGALQVVSGSHLLPFPRPDRVPAKQVETDPIFRQALTVPVPAGGMLFTHYHLLHGAGPNRSDGPRRSMTLGYCPVDELGSEQPPNRICVRGERAYRGHPGEQG